MTCEELRIEANKLGYTLVKKKENVKLDPCVCGYNRRELWSYAEKGICYYYYQCKKCGVTSKDYSDRNILQAKKGWNRFVEDHKNK